MVFFSFTFKNSNPNPFFEETKLTKTFTICDEGITKISAHTHLLNSIFVIFDTLGAEMMSHFHFHLGVRL